MTLEQIDARLAAAQAQLLAACTDLIETYRATIVPALFEAIRTNLVRPLRCPVCAKYYAVGVAETRALMCCGFEALSPLCPVPAGRGLFVPAPDQFVEPPAIVAAEVPTEIPW